MKGYPDQIYMAASWGGAAGTVAMVVLRELDRRGLTVVGDHPDNKAPLTDGNGGWQSRPDFTLRSCRGVVAVLPVSGGGGTTPYILPELLLAARHGLPLLIVTQEGVLCRRSPDRFGKTLHFGESARDPSALGSVLRTYPALAGEWASLQAGHFLTNEELQKADSVNLEGVAGLWGPIANAGVAVGEVLHHALDAFMQNLGAPSWEPYVFHVAPFSMERQHTAVASAVFSSSGMRCVRSIDSLGSDDTVRQHWRSELSGAELVIADLSRGNRNCLFEVGVASGLGIPVRVVHRERRIEKQFGLDDYEFRRYRSLRKLESEVAEICADYRRRVFNLEPPIAADDLGEGIPDWYERSEGGPVVDWLAVGGGGGLVGVVALAIAGVLTSSLLLTIIAVTGAALVGGATFYARLFPSVTRALDTLVDARPRAFAALAVLFSLVCLLILAATVHGQLPDSETAQPLGDAPLGSEK